MTTIPSTFDDVTAEWLAEATGLPISEVTLDQIGTGIGVSSALYRVECAGEHCPTSLVVKLPALDEAAVFTATVLRMYIREVRFFDELAALSPIRVPASHHAAVDEETSRFVVVMEDLGDLRAVDQNVGMEGPDAERCVDELARWHARWWRSADGFAARGAAIRLDDPIYPAILPTVFAEGWAKLQAEMGSMPDAIVEVAPRWSDAHGGLLAELAMAPTTLVHGDYRADNMLFEADGTLALLDFQLTGVGSGAYDLAYFVTQSLDPQTASANERALFDRYVVGLVAAGVPEADTDHLWDGYRAAALFCLVYPVVASRGMDLDDPRQRSLVEAMLTRFARAVDELSLAELL